MWLGKKLISFDLEMSASKEIVCDFFCKASYDYHRCSDETFKELIDCDVPNIIDDLEDEKDEELDILTFFPCANCDTRFKSYEALKVHFSSDHTLKTDLKCS